MKDNHLRSALNNKTKERDLVKSLLGFLRKSSGSFVIFWSFIVIILGKVCTVIFPLFFKKALDVLGHSPQAYPSAIFLLLGYGLFRVLSFGLGDFRDILFAPFEQRVVRDVSKEVFAHLHQLPLSFHLNRKTGGVSTAID